MKILLLIAAVLVTSCAADKKFNRDKRAFTSAKTISRYKSAADNNDIYFELKENNFFEFYMKLFDSVKNTAYPGRYTKTGDTLYLDFYSKKGRDLIGRKALITPGKKEIVFFDSFPAVKKSFIFN